MTTQEAYDLGFNAAKQSCLSLLAKWFFFNSPQPRGCLKDMQAIQPQPLK